MRYGAGERYGFDLTMLTSARLRTLEPVWLTRSWREIKGSRRIFRSIEAIAGLFNEIEWES